MSRSRKKGVSTEWTKHLPSEAERKEFETSLRHDTLILSRLIEILDERLKSLDKEEVSLTSYENPSWGYKQAHINGVKSGLTTVRNLLGFL